MIGWDNIKPADPAIERAMIEYARQFEFSYREPSLGHLACRKCTHFYRFGGASTNGTCRSHKRWTAEDAFCQPREPQRFEPRI
jgi:hypothetical protein